MMGWIIFFTMLAGWVADVLLSRGFTFFFAPAFANWGRSTVYATGRLFLSFVCACVLGLAIVFSLKIPYAGVIMAAAVGLLLLVAFAAQIGWILYLYRTAFFLSVGFYAVIVVAHALVGVLIARPMLGGSASTVVTDFVDRVITPRLRAEVDSTKSELTTAAAARDAVKAKVTDFQNQLDLAQAEQGQLRQEIEAKKNSDIYVLSQIIQVRAHGELRLAAAELAAFLAKFPTSPLDDQARSQLSQVQEQLTVETAQKQQEEINAARVEAQARADLLAHAAKGQVTLSEMRRALIGKTRDQVTDLLGQPSGTASDSWGYRQQMIFDPLTNEKSGLIVNFSEGLVQGVDYYRNGGPQ
jgi:hypothetical protein